MFLPSSSALTETDLRSNLRLSLAKSGVVDDLTASLRATFVERMSKGRGGTQEVPKPGQGPRLAWGNKAKDKENLTLGERAVRSLVMGYLEQAGMRHTLSVFAPEAGMDEPLSAQDCLRSLGLR